VADVLTKPLNIDRLLDSVRRLVAADATTTRLEAD
jgi:hypothetical protein